MHGRVRLPTFAVVATGECEQFVARVHPKNGEPADRPTVEMDARLIASAKAVAQLLIEAVGFAAEALESDEPVSGADLVEFHASWRLRALRLLEGRSS